jgi:hypothetical protein
VDFSTMSVMGDARSAPSRPSRQATKLRRRVKLVAASALAVLVGLGSYALTYRVLVVVSTPAVASSAVPATSGGGSTATVPVTATPAQPQS